MPIPANAVTIEQPFDPRDVLEVKVGISQGAEDANPAPILLLGESVASLGVAVSTEAAAIGLKIVSGTFEGATYPSPSISQNVVTFWVTVDEARRGDAAFDGAGVTVGVELTFKTNNNPPRVKQRTVALRMAQQ